MIERRVLPSGQVTYRVRYYGPDRRQRSRSFKRRRDAEAYAVHVGSELQRGAWLDPRRGKATVAEMWAEYERHGMGHLRETTRQNYRQGWRTVAPSLGAWQVGRLEHADVANWVVTLSTQKGPDAVRLAHQTLLRVLDHAMRNRRIAVNPARGVLLPRRPPARERILTAAQVDAMADGMGDQGEVVLALVYLGLRWSELAALRVADIDLARRRVRVVERATEVGGKMDVSAPKSRASTRHIAIPSLLLVQLERRPSGRAPEALVFPAPDGGYLRNGNWRRQVRCSTVTSEIGLAGITPHDLRRTYGSLARLAGADLRFIQRAMGHESITTTARIYAHLYDGELDTIAEAMDRLRKPEKGP